MALECDFDPVFAGRLSLREKQLQQSYRPIIGIHKWFARRPGTLFRNLLLAEFNGTEPVDKGFWHSHRLEGVIADPFMGGGTPLFEANRLGFSVLGTDINPMAYWIVRQSLSFVDLASFEAEAAKVCEDVEGKIGHLYRTRCVQCNGEATVKYFIWVKQQACGSCGEINDLFPSYLLAEAIRHPKNVLICGACGNLNEFDDLPSRERPAQCTACGHDVKREGTTQRGSLTCTKCSAANSVPPKVSTGPPSHRLCAIEYLCEECRGKHKGRFFKVPDADDERRFVQASLELNTRKGRLTIPPDAIPAGDETARLHRWGYNYYHELFNSRQLLGLGLLLERIQKVKEESLRDALLTVFSDFIRYQNMLCRYDSYGLKCQDIFSVHGFPVGLMQCENNVLGILESGAGGFRHFVKKFRKAKEYCESPFETRYVNRRKQRIPILGEKIEATVTKEFLFPSDERTALLEPVSAESITLPKRSLDGVFTDPPYYDNVQYAELMDFCYVWLRLALKDRHRAFDASTTRSKNELTGNVTSGKGLEHFTHGLSEVFRTYADALKIGAPFVFTYHHNELEAYLPLVVAILDAKLVCQEVYPAPAEMAASIHIAGTGSSILDSVFVCRRTSPPVDKPAINNLISRDIAWMQEAGVKVSRGDVACLIAGQLAGLAVNSLSMGWKSSDHLGLRLARARGELLKVAARLQSPEAFLMDANRSENSEAQIALPI